MNTRISTVAAAAMLLASLSVQAASHGAMPAPAHGQAMSASGAIAKGEGPGKIADPHAGTATRGEQKAEAEKRRDVKAEAKRAVKNDKIAKGEGSAKVGDPHAGTATRSEQKAEAEKRREVKAEAAAAVKSGDIAKGPNVPATGGVTKP